MRIEDRLAAAFEAGAEGAGPVRVVRVRRSTGRSDGGAVTCANPESRRPLHPAGRERWVVTMERLANLREVRAYVCSACAEALADDSTHARRV